MKLGIFLALLGLGLTVRAVTVTVDSCVQDATSGQITTTYTLSGGSAVVTFGLQDSAGQPVSPAAAAGAGGDVNRLLAAGSHTCIWTPGLGAGEIADGFKIVLTAWAESNPPDWMVVDPSTGDRTYFEDKAQLPGTIAGPAYKSSLLAFRHIRAKGQSFYMGSDSSDAGHLANETRHQVTFANDYYLGVYPVTQGQYRNVMGTNPSYATEFQNASAYTNADWRAVERVSYADLRGDTGANWPTDGHAVTSASFLGVLRANTGYDAFDLPTEAEWEYACRAGTTSAYNNGKDYSYDNMLEVAWVTRNSLTSDSAAALVGLKAPNAWGLYDMHGTIYEFCLDWYSEDLGSAAVTAPTGPSSGTDRVVRGGGMAFANDTVGYKLTRSAGRRPAALWNGSRIATLMLGFRLACAIPVAAADEPVSAVGEPACAARTVVSLAEQTAHGTVENPFEAWDRAFAPMSIERFNSFPPTGILLIVR